MIEPLVSPFEPDVAAQLEQMMPAGAPPIALFRTFAKNLPMTKAMHAWGSYELGRTLSLTLREREIVIDRTCPRCGCEYEWGVHVAFFAAKAELTAAQITSLTHGDASDVCWASEPTAFSSRLSTRCTTHPTSATRWLSASRASWPRLSSSTCSCSPAGTTRSASWRTPPGFRSSRARHDSRD